MIKAKGFLISRLDIDDYHIAIRQYVNKKGLLYGTGWFEERKREHYYLPPRILNIKYEDKIYIARLFDGEGCIVISKNIKKDDRKVPTYVLMLDITNLNHAIIEWVYKTIGFGSIRISKEKYMTWKVSGTAAGSILLTILPFLKIKKERAKLGISFMKTYHDLDLKENIRNKIMRLNHNAENFIYE